MNRLRDGEGEGDDPLFQRGVELLRRTPATPPAADDVKARVWRALRQTTPAGRRPLILKLAVVAGVALVAGSAGAVIASRMIANGWFGARPGAATPPVAAPPVRQVSRTPSPVQSADLDVGGEPAETGDAPAPPEPGRPARPAAHSAPKRAPVPGPSAAAVARERTEVLDALIALRREHDPARAGTLLGRYLAAHPRGALREEALVLAIEAADARGDRAAGAELARAYQAEYPAGRFLSFARSH
jgi:hypothetical protein